MEKPFLIPDNRFSQHSNPFSKLEFNKYNMNIPEDLVKTDVEKHEIFMAFFVISIFRDLSFSDTSCMIKSLLDFGYERI